MTRNQDAIRRLFPFDKDSTGNLPSMPGIFPDYPAPIVRHVGGSTELTLARWGMPSSQFAQMQAAKKRAAKLEQRGDTVDFKELLRMEPDSGTTNIRNLDSKHWKRWLGVEARCLVPFTSFSEFNKAEGGDIWFAFNEDRPLAFFAGIWTNWTSVRKVKEGETTNDIFAFLTTEPNAEVGAIHPKAMPVILTKPEELQTWMTAPPDEAMKLQRPLPDRSLQIIARGKKRDEAPTP
jgi:putative SOS response-associated peptidase YedK